MGASASCCNHFVVQLAGSLASAARDAHVFLEGDQTLNMLPESHGMSFLCDPSGDAFTSAYCPVIGCALYRRLILAHP